MVGTMSQDGRHWAIIEREHHSGDLFDGVNGVFDLIFSLKKGGELLQVSLK